jgi:hypothetical protein
VDDKPTAVRALAAAATALVLGALVYAISETVVAGA